jgi:hypothetical protein
MKTIKNSKDITTLEVGDVVMFGDLKYKVRQSFRNGQYYIYLNDEDIPNDTIFEYVKLNKRTFIESLGINAHINTDFPEVKSLEALTAIVSALYKEYEKQNELPKTWEEFCEKYYLKGDEAFITSTSELNTVRESFGRRFRLCEENKNLCISEKEAEAFLALMQLRQLRKAYVKDWEPDWNNTKQYKACIMYNGTDFFLTYFKDVCSRPLSFPTCELAQQFLTNFKDLLEIAKPLL